MQAMTRFAIGSIVVFFLIVAWLLTVDVGTQISGGLDEWLVR